MNLILSIICLLILLLCMFYTCSIVFSQVKRQKLFNQFHKQELVILSEKLELMADPVNKLGNNSNNIAWDGYRKFILKGKVLESEGICSFYFSPHDKKPLPAFMPGQYLTFKVNIPGQTKPITRCYSLSDSPNHSDYYRVTVKRIPPPRDNPELDGGLMSNYFHRELQEGDIVDVKAPSGQFFLDTAHMNPIVLVGGGVGVTPVLSMLNYLASSGQKREVWFFYGVRDSNEHIMLDHINNIDRENDNIHVQTCYSRPLTSDVLIKHYHHKERVSVDLFKSVLPSNNFDFYLCGAPPMMQSIVHDLKEWGVSDSKLHFEAFGPATVKKVASEDSHKVKLVSKVSVKFKRSNKELDWDGASSSILEFAESIGIALESGCRSGNCGACALPVHKGEVEYFSPQGATIEEGECLTCISTPKSDIVLDA